MTGRIVLAALITAGCSTHNPEDAKKCRVAEAELNRAIEDVSRMKPYSGRRLGKCDVIVDDARNVLVITPEIRQSVDDMIAREKAGAKK